MENEKFGLTAKSRDSTWSNRILSLAIFGILFLTLYPFVFNPHAALRGITSPFLLGKSVKSLGFLDAFLNVLLFVPFGFGLAEKLRERGKSRALTLAVALAAGAIFSYTIEFLQIYIPERDSGWEDVLTNTSGSLVGALMFLSIGEIALRILNVCERALDSFLVEWRPVFVFVLYLGLWSAISISLQKETRLTNWSSDSLLVVGNDATGNSKWTGEIRLLQIWDRAVSIGAARRSQAPDAAIASQPGLRSYFDFTSPPPYRDLLNFLPALSWTSQDSARPGDTSAIFDGSSWLSSKVAVSDLVQDLQKSNQFSVRVVCTPAVGMGADGRIVSISQASGAADLTIRQDDANLVFWFRTGLSARRSVLTWYLPNIFKASQTRDILYSYDGSSLSLYIDGQRQHIQHRFGPSTALAIFLRRGKLGELSAYMYMYYALVFFPAGLLLGIAMRRSRSRGTISYVACVVFMLLAPLVLEGLLDWVSAHSFFGSHLALSYLFLIAGTIWINVDRENVELQ
jgi:glycopeptide antibiotics resistance protein